MALWSLHVFLVPVWVLSDSLVVSVSVWMVVCVGPVINCRHPGSTLSLTLDSPDRLQHPLDPGCRISSNRKWMDETLPFLCLISPYFSSRPICSIWVSGHMLSLSEDYA